VNFSQLSYFLKVRIPLRNSTTPGLRLDTHSNNPMEILGSNMSVCNPINNLKMTKRRRTSKLLIKRKGGVARDIKYFVSAVHEERVNKSGLREYMVSWQGYSRCDDSWIRTLPSYFAQQWMREKEFSNGVDWMWHGDNYSQCHDIELESTGDGVESDLHILANVACQEFDKVFVGC
jgi:hypothetical protein